MKALILAGGSGTRLRPITYTSAKQLVPVANTPILFYGLRQVAEAGITEVGIIVGDTRAEVIEAVGDGSSWGLDVTYLPQDEPRGLAHCVLIAREFLAEDDFVMYLGDNLLERGIADFVATFETSRGAADRPQLDGPEPPPAAQILLKQVPDPHRFGVAELDRAGRAVRLVEKPADPPSDLALVGVYLFTPAIHEAVAQLEPSARGELEITDAIQWLIDQGHRVDTQVLEGWWIDTGKLTPLLEANRLILENLETAVVGKVDDESVLEGRVVVEDGAIVERSRVRGPAVIGPGALVRDSYIGPFTAIGPGCEVIGSEVEHSVLLAGSRVVDVPRVVDSLLGREAEVVRAEGRPAARRVMIGDHSRVELP